MAAVGDTGTRKRAIVVPAIVVPAIASKKHRGSAWTQLSCFLKLSPKEQRKRVLDGFKKSNGKEGYCVASDVTPEQFVSKCDTLEKNGQAKSFRWELKDGKVWIYEIPTRPHEAAAAAVKAMVSVALGPELLGFDMSNSPTCGHPHLRGGMEPDGSFTYDGVGRPGPGHQGRADDDGNRWPNLIIESAFDETMTHVCNKAIRWLSEGNHPRFGVKQVIVINIGDVRAGQRTRGTRSMKAWRYEQQLSQALLTRFTNHFAAFNPGATPFQTAMVTLGLARAMNSSNNPVQTAEFGIPNRGNGNGATTHGQPGMVFQLPMASLFHPSPVPATLPATVDIDLYHVRVRIERAGA